MPNKFTSLILGIKEQFYCKYLKFLFQDLLPFNQTIFWSKLYKFKSKFLSIFLKQKSFTVKIFMAIGVPCS